MPDTDWVVQRGANRFPAADVAVLQQWAASGNVRSDDQVWSPIRGDWAVAAETPEIADLLVRPTAAVAVRPLTEVASQPDTVPRASAGLRAAAYLIDVIPAVLIGLIAILPLIGHIIAGLLLGFYWLYRDASGYSLGKRALGLHVVQANGELATRQALIRRNLPFAIAAFVTAIPFLGIVLGPITGFVAVAATALLLLSEGYSLGDKWAGTTVIKRG
jgi:uncharacterized RDD family membrane protein YckC